MGKGVHFKFESGPRDLKANMWGNDKVDSSVPQLLSGHCDLGGYHIYTDLGDGTHRSVPFAGRAWRVSGTFS